MYDLLISNCDVLAFKDDSLVLLKNHNVGIKGNLIEAVTPVDDSREDASLKTIPARGLLAVPGFINTHAHVPMVLFRGLAEDVSITEWFNDYIWPLESNLTPDDVYWGAMLGIAEMIEAGVPFVADHYFFMDEVARAVEDSGIRANLAWAVFAHEGEQKLDQTCEFIDRWHKGAGGRIDAWLGPHAPYTTGPDFLKLCAQRANDLGVGIHTHVSETSDQVRLSLEQHGITPVEMLLETGVLEVPTILAHCLYPTDRDIEILAKHPAGIAHAPKTYLKLGMGAAPVLRFLEAGIPVGLATDGAVSSNTLDILEQLRLMALVIKDRANDSTTFPIHTVLDTTFHGGATVVRHPKTLGEISPGRLADLTLVRQDELHTFPRYDPAANLVYSSRSSDVHTVICNGEILLADGQLQKMDKKVIKQEVQQRLERLSQRVPGNRIALYPA